MLTELRKERWFVASLERGLAVIAAFADARPSLSVPELAKRSGTSRASARRLAMTLEALGYLRRTEDNRYFLAPPTLALGTAYLSSHGIRGALQPVLRQLRDRSGLSSSVAVLDEGEIIYVARASAPGPLRIRIDVGQRLPAYATAMGRVLVAALPETAFEAWLQRTSLEPLTDRTITDPERFRQEIKKVREQGFSSVDGELAPSIRVLAVPILSDGGRTVAAINVTTQTGLRREEDALEVYLPELRRAAAEVSVVWGHLDMQASDANPTLGQ